MPTIDITIDTDGSTKIDVDGVKGKGCESLTADIEKALGKTTSQQKKPEYHQQAARQSGKAVQG